MRNLLALAAFCVITFATVGYFQGWYAVKADITTDGKRNLNIDFNTKNHSRHRQGHRVCAGKIKTIEENEKKNVKAPEESGSAVKR